jgi:FkbM family methyltransferase
MTSDCHIIDVLIHLGAGHCSELEHYLTLQPGHLLLVEADPRLADNLQARTAGLSQTEVICAAVSSSPGPATLHCYNLPGAASLHKATGLQVLFPGLKIVDHVEVEAIRPESLLQSLQLSAQQNNILVIDLPGEEFSVLQALQESRLLHTFRELFVNCGREPLYEGSIAAQEILQWLREQGFDLVDENDRQDPDRPCWALRCDPLRLEHRTLQAQVEQLTQAMNEQTRLADDYKTLNHQLRRERDEAIQSSAEQREQTEILIALQTDISQQLAILQTELAASQQAKAALEQIVEHQTNQLGQLSLERDALLAQLGQLTQELVELQAQLGQLTQERESLQAQLGQLTQEWEALHSRYMETHQLAENQKHELLEAQRTVALSVKLQTLREADLKELQNRYQESIGRQEEQHQLLVKLTERLNTASVYLHRLTNNPKSGQTADQSIEAESE